MTTVRFGTDLWQLIEAEAALAGVSASQFIREASLARAAATAAARGEDPLGLLAAASASAEVPEPESPQLEGDAGERSAALRRRAIERRSEGLAAIAQSEQAIRRAHELRDEGRSLRQRDM